ncbi:MAG: MBL fold metallo-hydrolase [Proteobacteria bacterium]|nr:MBL fold metallo-hydrolase [Pseudomonadota bacterium]
MHIEVKVLGSGTSTGVPVVGCDCQVCLSDSSYNKRLRSSILISRQDNQEHVIVDTSPDLRAQLLSQGWGSGETLKKVLYTHTHADHSHGFDDLRVFCFRDKKPIDVFLKQADKEDLMKRFSYAFEASLYSGVVPQIQFHHIQENAFALWPDVWVEPYFLPHGTVQSTAFRLGRFAYATDFQNFSEKQIRGWQGKIDTMIASGVHMRSHPTHSSIPETLALFDRLEVRRGILTHLSHEVDYVTISSQLPPGRELAFDGMCLSVDIGDVSLP